MASAPRYVLSERAANALRELIAPGVAYGARPRPAHDPQGGARLRPFACRLAGAEQPRLRVYLPPETAQAVRFRGYVIPPADAIGTADEPWRPYALPDDGELYLRLAFEQYEPEPGRVDYRAVAWSLGPYVEPDGGGAWPHLVCAIEPELGLVQYHLGSLLVGDPNAEAAPPPELPPSCGNPINGGGAVDENPLDKEMGEGGHDRPGNNSETGNPLDGEGDGGYTPMCAEDLNIDPFAA